MDIRGSTGCFYLWRSIFFSGGLDSVVTPLQFSYMSESSIKMISNGQTALTFAISARQAKASRRLLEYPGTDLNHRDQLGCSALALAIMDRQRDLVKRLLLHDHIDINQIMSPGLDGYR